MKIETGSVYRVKHRQNGEFYFVVKFSDNAFTTGIVLSQKCGHFHGENQVSRGNELTVQNNLCEFERVQIREE